MKKRRDLNALVSGGKVKRKHSSSSHELLRYNGSESSDEDCKVLSRKIEGPGLCSTCTSVLAFLLLMACLLITAGLAWMHVEMRKDLEALRITLQAVESRSASNGDNTQKLLLQVSSMNKTIQEQTKMLQTLTLNISNINNTVQAVSGEVSLVTEGLKLAPELKLLPDKLVTLSSTVAKMGSDVEGMKDKVDASDLFMKTTNTRLGDIDTEIHNLNQSQAKPSDQPDNSVSPEVAKMIQDLTKEMTKMNSSLSTQVSLLMSTSTKYQEQLLQFENTTKQLAKNLTSVQPGVGQGHSDVSGNFDSVEFREAVTDIVNDLLTDKGLVGSEEVHSLVKNITNILANLQKGTAIPLGQTIEPEETEGDNDVSPADHVTMAMFNTLGDGFKDKIDILNDSLVSLRSDVKKMSQTLFKHDSTMFNLSHQVQALQKYITILQHDMESTGALTTSVPTTKSPEDMEQESDGGEQLPGENMDTGAPENPNSETEHVTENKEVSQPTVVPVPKLTVPFIQSPEGNEEAAPPTVVPVPILDVPFIKTLKEFELNFSRWDRSGSGQIRFGDLEGFVGTSNLPLEADMKRLYDLDNNGLYSKAELARAFGITLTTTTSPASAAKMTEPPR
ncbi:uncharacterized protein LOC128213732 isoform X2 [Mya arenaria]|uniref:uncharacterized protein LOC128213732 isoform X2 n=1 Tax=Mya arenaria TaxID=6604 RepID=UPI0022E8E6F7|nr:uncharacterized protein LOC128213732 isoform X2 [Mya arenaria]